MVTLSDGTTYRITTERVYVGSDDLARECLAQHSGKIVTAIKEYQNRMTEIRGDRCGLLEARDAIEAVRHDRPYVAEVSTNENEAGGMVNR